MDNPEYILQQDRDRRTAGPGSSNYHTLGIPILPSPTSSSGPASLPAPPYTSLSSTGSHLSSAGPPPGPALAALTAPATTGLNGAVGAGRPGSHPRSSDGESDHEYYNDLDRLKRELQPLQQPPRNETTV